MEIRNCNWKCIVDEVKYWDAIDLIRNLEEEMEKVRNGLIHWVFSPTMNFPSLSGLPNTVLLSPEIRETEDGIQIAFSNLRGILHEDLTIEINDNELIVTVIIPQGESEKLLGQFKMHVPIDFDIESCDATLEHDSLKICLRRISPTKKAKKIVKIK
ncbi:MAG TPA: Hsp20 family protein [Euryarchaeota archaeon]|nr:Hsp20 family protein [Euryarchaeota archaeon]